MVDDDAFESNFRRLDGRQLDHQNKQFNSSKKLVNIKTIRHLVIFVITDSLMELTLIALAFLNNKS